MCIVPDAALNFEPKIVLLGELIVFHRKQGIYLMTSDQQPAPSTPEP
jgi:hypothetical protein